MKKLFHNPILSCPVCASNEEKIIQHKKGIILWCRGERMLGLRKVNTQKNFPVER